MWRDLSTTADSPTPLNNKIIACYDSVDAKLLELSTDGVTNLIFSQDDCLNTNGVNDFHYLISLLISIYYDMKVTNNNEEEEIDKEQIWLDNHLEDYIQYFWMYHNTDIEPMYEIFELGNYPFGSSLFGDSADYLDIQPLFPL